VSEEFFKIRKTKKRVRESFIEGKVTAWAKKNGWLSYKWVSPSNAGVPDRLFFKDGRVVIIEFKAPGKKPTPLQSRVIATLRLEGLEVYVIDDYERGINALQE